MGRLIERPLMPLLELDADTAWGNMLSPRGLAQWPGGSARLLPHAAPGFEPSFEITPGSKIFTMGSCFARNIERSLEARGFDVPTRRHFGNMHIINKYNPFSMLQEVRRALELDPPLSPAQRLLRVADDAWLDLHLHRSKPTTRDEILDLGEQCARLFLEIIGCPFFIVTLGLIEVWFDLEAGVYVNEPPRFSRYRDDPELQPYCRGRLVFRLLAYDEVLAATSELMTRLRQASPDCRVLLTVSPVPLSGTFTGRDVLEANTYSKSALRTAAEEMWRRFDFVDYFPSYESVMLSPRETTWEEDGVHVREDVVELNVARMMARYVKGASAS